MLAGDEFIAPSGCCVCTPMFQHFLNSEHLENTGVLGCNENWPTPKS